MISRLPDVTIKVIEQLGINSMGVLIDSPEQLPAGEHHYTPHSKLQEAEDKYQQDLIAEKCRHSDNVEAVREHFQSKLDEAEKHIRCLKHNLEVCHEHLAKRDQKIIELRGKLDGGKTADDILKGLGSTTNE